MAFEELFAEGLGFVLLVRDGRDPAAAASLVHWLKPVAALVVPPPKSETGILPEAYESSTGE